MTTVILTMIGILIAGAAALMMVFYGGDAFTSSAASADAARLVVEGEQISRAINSYQAQEGTVPGGGGASETVEQALKDKKFLSSMPKGTTSNWVIDYPRNMIRVEVGLSTDERARTVCIAARKQLKIPNPTVIYQCDGSDAPPGVTNARDPCCLM